MASRPDDQSCAICRYYIDDVEECHRNPPVQYQGIEAIGHWPEVGPSEWCGEFGKIPGTPPAVPTHKEGDA